VQAESPAKKNRRSSTYVGAGVAVLLAVVGIYFFFLTQKEKKETTTFDPNRHGAYDAVLKAG